MQKSIVNWHQLEKTLGLNVEDQLIAVGTKMPKWVEEGFNEYKRRFPRHAVRTRWNHGR